MKYKGLTYSYTVYAFTFFLAPLLLILFYSLTAAGGDGGHRAGDGRFTVHIYTPPRGWF